jgi:cell division protein FtsB
MGRESPLRPASSRVAARRRTWLVRGTGAVLLALTFGYLPYHIYARSNFGGYLKLCADLRAIKAQNARLQAENDRLARQAEALRSDPRALERVARAELGWVRPGEVIFDLASREPNR